jgi:hypothetical protein
VGGRIDSKGADPELTGDRRCDGSWSTRIEPEKSITIAFEARLAVSALTAFVSAIFEIPCFVCMVRYSLKRNGPTTGPFPTSERLRSVATPHVPDDDLVAAPFADGHIAAVVSAPISPLIAVAISPIVNTIIIATFTLAAAVRSDADIQLSKRDFGLRTNNPSISSGCRESPHCGCNGGDKRQFSHSNLLLCR